MQNPHTRAQGGSYSLYLLIYLFSYSCYSFSRLIFLCNLNYSFPGYYTFNKLCILNQCLMALRLKKCDTELISTTFSAKDFILIGGKWLLPYTVNIVYTAHIHYTELYLSCKIFFQTWTLQNFALSII